MKNLVTFCAVFCFISFSCNKDSALTEDNGCIERKILPVTAHSISSTEITIADNLFSSAGINNRNYRYYRYTHDTLQTLYPPFTKIDEKGVRVDQFLNRLRIFTGDLAYLFHNDIFHYRGGNLTNGTTLNTTPQLRLGQLRKLFIDNVEQFEHIGNRYKDTCLNAEFGYYNLNTGTSNTPELLIKAWRVTQKNNDYPLAYYQDDDGKLIYYFNGIMTFK